MKTYITVRQRPRYEQMSLEEFLFEAETKPNIVVATNTSNTKTYEVNYISDRFAKLVDIEMLIHKLNDFNSKYAELRMQPRDGLYDTFYIPKKSGGLRRIDAPEPVLMNALRELKNIFEDDFRALYHTSAFAYVKHRSIHDAVKKHQMNESNWYGKFDLSNFFGSTTLDFVIKMLGMVYPFSEVIRNSRGKEELTKALELAFLNGGLPQGTPISPLITNVMMIPIDFKLTRELRGFEGSHFVYTRYADDMIISARKHFNVKSIERLLVSIFKEYNAPFCLNTDKTRYGSRTGRNWNLGLMVNQNNEITVGSKKKRQFQAMLSSYIMDKLNGKSWDRHDLQVMEGYRNYYRMIEGETIDKIVAHIASKFCVETVQCNNGTNIRMLKDDLRA